MTNKLVVRNVEAQIVKALQETAARHNRSIKDEHREILRAALQQPTQGAVKKMLSGVPDVGTGDDFEFRKSEHVLLERQELVRSGQLLTASETWKGLRITRQALSRAVRSGRIFLVDVGGSQYYPAFYLAKDIDRKMLSKVTKRLGDLPGWSKLQFFTTPKASLANITPLQALVRGLVEQVESAASAFADR